MHAHQSFLIARGGHVGLGPVRTVFATDFSDYSLCCFGRFIDMHPLGLDHVTIVTVTTSAAERSARHGSSDDGGLPHHLEDTEAEMRRKGRQMVDRLVALGCTADYRLLAGHPQQALSVAMDDLGADLLVLGGRQHNSLRQFFAASLSLRETVEEKYSVLVIRIPSEN